jgi:hypothetical protein
MSDVRLSNNVARGFTVEKCPFCMHDIPEGATVCIGCHAEKGYTQAQGKVYGRALTIFYGIVLPGAIALGLFWLWLFHRGPDGEPWALYVTAFFLIPVVLSVWRLTTGPVWYRFTGG